MKAPVVFLLSLVMVALGSGCTAPKETKDESTLQSTPSFLLASNGCAILVGGSVGGQFTDRQLTELWFKVNRSVTNELFDRFKQFDYRVHKLLISPDEVGSTEKLIVLASAAHKCSRILQVSHHANQDAFGPYFRLDIELLRFEPKARTAESKGTNTVMVGEYQKSYRYARTKETMDRFYTGDFADLAFDDLRRTPVLKPIQ
jgi:hypothetical protein